MLREETWEKTCPDKFSTYIAQVYLSNFYAMTDSETKPIIPTTVSLIMVIYQLLKLDDLYCDKRLQNKAKSTYSVFLIFRVRNSDWGEKR